jgi:ribosomal protein S18 acetylase RimI-like enzyme
VTGDDFQIRPAKEQDVAELVKLCEAHAAFEGAWYSTAGKSEKLHKSIFENHHISCLVLEVSGNIRGYATYRPEFSTWDCAFYMHMDCLYLAPEERGKGFGRMMVDVIVAEAKKLGCANVQWQTPIDNQQAITFYKKTKAVPKEKMRFVLAL